MLGLELNVEDWPDDLHDLAGGAAVAAQISVRAGHTLLGQLLLKRLRVKN
jgi:hypothetical protein